MFCGRQQDSTDAEYSAMPEALPTGLVLCVAAIILAPTVETIDRRRAFELGTRVPDHFDRKFVVDTAVGENVVEAQKDGHDGKCAEFSRPGS